MYDKFSSQAKQIIVKSHKYALNNNEYVVGTEYLLLSLFNEPNSSCQILFKELDVTEAELKAEIKNINVFRKNIPGLVIYTPKFRLILDKAIDIAKKTDSDLVYEEHLFYALLITRDCIAYQVLENLDIDVKDIVNEIIDVMGWDLDEDNNSKDKLVSKCPFVENITQLVKSDKLLPLIGRADIIERINNILNKRNKRNVILIGNAGVGKSAIVEGLAQLYFKEKINKQIISLNITSLLAGTKYRGDFEQRIKDFLDSVSNKENIIVFIDEIHNIINVGNGDSNLDVANILKPPLARGDINCIGATTVDEYYKHIATDGALCRRFLPIFVDEPSIDETINIMTNIKSYYESYHDITIPIDVIPYLCNSVEKTIVNRYFPDKAIDILDEACSYAKQNGKKVLTNNIIDNIIHVVNNQKVNEKNLSKIEKYPFLKKYFLRYYSNIKLSYQPIVSILCSYNDEDQLENLVSDISFIFNIRSEAVKRINLNNFRDEYSISNLIGSPPGYVGFDNPNTLTKFVQKYPRSLILVKNIENGANNITQLFRDILKSGFIEDLASNKVYFTNTIILATENKKANSIGFLNVEPAKERQDDLKFDEYVNLSGKVNEGISRHESYLLNYITLFKNNNIELSFENYDYIINNIEEKLYSQLENLLFECLFKEKDREKIIIDYCKEEECFYIKK